MGSQFWKSLHKVKHLFKWGPIHRVGNGKITQFWNYVWISEVPLRVSCRNLYNICRDKDISVEACARNDWNFGLRRMMGETEMAEWTNLMHYLQNFTMSKDDDVVTWGLTPSKMFTTGSLYNFLTNGGMESKMAKMIWKCKIPLKIRIFLWQVFQDRLQTGQQLKMMKWGGSEHCYLCGKMENANHLLFDCPMAVFVWSFLGEAMGWQGFPSSLNDLTNNWLKGGFGVGHQLGLACFAGFAWAMWTTRNKMCI
jgi:hypothetical protein